MDGEKEGETAYDVVLKCTNLSAYVSAHVDNKNCNFINVLKFVLCLYYTQKPQNLPRTRKTSNLTSV